METCKHSSAYVYKNQYNETVVKCNECDYERLAKEARMPRNRARRQVNYSQENPFHPNGCMSNYMAFGSPYLFPGEIRPGVPFIVETEGSEVTESPSEESLVDTSKP